MIFPYYKIFTIMINITFTITIFIVIVITITNNIVFNF
jgi:hypothetical protein